MKSNMNIDSVLQTYYNGRITNNVYCMREILTISLPRGLKEAAAQKAKRAGFKSLSGYVKQLLSDDSALLSEKELWADIKAARKEYRAGKCVDADSVSLMDIYYGKKN